MIREISVILRKLQGAKSDRRLLAAFAGWKNALPEVTDPGRRNPAKKILIIRLDDIGDYLLFRNFLPGYKQSLNWKNHEVIYLGNIAVKPLFDTCDSGTVDRTIWIDKKRYFSEVAYRKNVWEQLYKENIEIVINPSRTRQLLLDDMCMLASQAAMRIGVENTHETPELNDISNQSYTRLCKDYPSLHEFQFNKIFVQWCCGIDIAPDRPEILTTVITPEKKEPYILLCIGAAHKSKRWPPSRWIELVRLLSKNNLPVATISGSKAEEGMAKEIADATGAHNITGATTLPEMIEWMRNASAAVCNDSMAAHLAVCCKTPLVMLSNGNKFYRFTAYREAGIEKAITIYAAPFLKKWKSKKHPPHKHYIPVTKDMHTIKAVSVLNALHQLLHQSQ